MLPMSDTQTFEQAQLEDVLHEVVETLAPIERAPCSPGERQAAEWLGARLQDIDGVHVELEDEPSWGRSRRRRRRWDCSG